MSQFLIIIGRHLKCAIQTELVVGLELALTERKQSDRFRHNSIICQKDSTGPLLGRFVGWYCAYRSKVMQS